MSKFIIPVIVFLLAGFMIYRTWMNHKSGDENFEQGQQFLVDNGTKEGVITTESGLQYLVLEEGTGTEHPTKNSKVTVHYHGTLIDGTPAPMLGLELPYILAACDLHNYGHDDYIQSLLRPVHNRI
jgi:hypothetical protein